MHRFRRKSYPFMTFKQDRPQNNGMANCAVQHSGYMYLERKQGLVKKTKKIWLELCGRELKYYKRNPLEDPQIPKGTISLDVVQTVKKIPTESHNTLRITTNKDTIRLTAESDSACDEWVSKLHEAMRQPSSTSFRTLKTSQSTLRVPGRTVEKRTSQTLHDHDPCIQGESLDTYENLCQVTAPPTSTPETVRASSSTQIQERNSASSGYETGDALNEQEHATYDDAMQSPEQREPQFPANEALRRALLDMGMDVNGDHPPTNVNGVLELKDYIETKLLVSV